MLKVTTYSHVDGNELFELCEEEVSFNVYRAFCEYYEINDLNSVWYHIAKTEREIKEEERSGFKEVISKILLENGFHRGDSLYIDL